jgi:hypothetical protein
MQAGAAVLGGRVVHGQGAVLAAAGGAATVASV